MGVKPNLRVWTGVALLSRPRCASLWVFQARVQDVQDANGFTADAVHHDVGLVNTNGVIPNNA